MKSLIAFTIGVLLWSLTSCKVYQVDYNTLPEEDKQKLHQQRYNSHVRIQSGWINNPFYWDNGYYGNWNGWQNYNRFRSPAIIIKRQPNKQNGRNRNTGYSRPNMPTKPIRKVNPTLPTRVKGRRGQKQ